MVRSGGVTVLSGAGLSTESGIPDYRGSSGASLRKHAPMTFQAFTREPQARHRYWARSFIGWPRMRVAQPNAGHAAVASLEAHGLVTGVITQNVDGLHSKAGSREVIDLHGRLSRVMCLACQARFPREQVHAELEARNTEWQPQVLHINPDGDVDVQPSDLDTFTMVDCFECAGPLKPDVVYFGETVPADRVTEAMAMLERASSLLVLGSSLTVYSGRRFVVRAAALGIPVAIVNLGPTRGDEQADIKIEAPLGATLTALLGAVAD
jgi:NAD-dependent SIR2 family protein deacetylase